MNYETAGVVRYIVEENNIIIVMMMIVSKEDNIILIPFVCGVCVVST